jgi:hypothetical protein
MAVNYDYDLFTAVEMVMVIVISHSQKNNYANQHLLNKLFLIFVGSKTMDSRRIHH